MASVTRIRRRAAVGLAIAAAAAACAAAILLSLPSSASTRDGGGSIPPSVARQLAKVALRAAKAQGDNAPTSILAVRTTHNQALRVATPGDQVPNGTASVYLIVMKGSFTPRYISMPPGAQAPARSLHWRYLSIVVTERTFQVADLGIAPHAPRVPISSLGHVTHLRARGSVP